MQTSATLITIYAIVLCLFRFAAIEIKHVFVARGIILTELSFYIVNENSPHICVNTRIVLTNIATDHRYNWVAIK